MVLKSNRFSPYKALHHLTKNNMLPPAFPIHIQLDLSNACNSNCKWCFFNHPDYTNVKREDFGREALLPTDTVLKNLPIMKECGVKTITIVGGGEATIHPGFHEIITEINRLGFKWGLVSNLMREFSKGEIEELAKAAWIRVSVDAICSETYIRTHRPKAKPDTAFGTVLANIALLAGMTTVGFSFLVAKENYTETFEAVALAKSLGCRYVQLKPVYGMKEENLLSDEEWDAVRAQTRAAIVEMEDEMFKIIDNLSRHEDVHAPRRDYLYCYAIRFQAQVTPSGCYPCCILKYNPKYNYGRLQDADFKTIFQSAHKATTELGIIVPFHCPPCYADEGNRVLNYLLSEEKEDVDFV